MVPHLSRSKSHLLSIRGELLISRGIYPCAVSALAHVLFERSKQDSMRQREASWYKYYTYCIHCSNIAAIGTEKRCVCTYSFHSTPLFSEPYMNMMEIV